MDDFLLRRVIMVREERNTLGNIAADELIHSFKAVVLHVDVNELDRRLYCIDEQCSHVSAPYVGCENKKGPVE
jgi:hypothetical protein